jgi:hypothetical protein
MWIFFQEHVYERPEDEHVDPAQGAALFRIACQDAPHQACYDLLAPLDGLCGTIGLAF